MPKSLRMIPRTPAGRGLFLALACLFLSWHPASPADAGQAVPDAAALQLRWEVTGNVTGPDLPEGRSRARFTLTNQGSRSFPASGWSLYFNCIAGVVEGNGPGDLTTSHVAGTLFRIRPAAATAGIPPGESLRLPVEHPEIMLRIDKAPSGPYLVFDDQPGVAYPIRTYQRIPLPRQAQLEGAPEGVGTLVDAEAIYRQNAAIADLPPDRLAPVLPTPRHVQRSGAVVHLATLPRLMFPRRLAAEAGLARAMLEPQFQTGPSGTSQAVPLRLSVGRIPGQSSPEAYRLTIDRHDGIAVTGNSAAGVFYGLQSLRQLLPPAAAAGGVDLPEIRLTDAPRYRHRGLMMDVARNFQAKETVFGILDLMARYKLNVLHLHLADDEGWRLDIPALPELTGVGARRGYCASGNDCLPPAYGSGPDVTDPHGSGHYSQDDYVAILRYARARHIQVIPEIEMPGHARAAVKAMEARYRRLMADGQPAQAQRYLLSDLADRSSYRSAQLYSDNVISPALPSTYRFIDTTVAELARLHARAGMPLTRLHVGGDELADGAWRDSPAAAALMRREGIRDTAGLWDYFYDRVDRILARHGVKAAGWEELGARRIDSGGTSRLAANRHFLGHGFVLQVWNNLEGSEDLAYTLANAGYDVVLSPASHLYFDMAHTPDAAEPGVNWAVPGGIDLPAVYRFDPFDFAHAADRATVPLSATGKRHIIGLEGALFSETVREPERLQYLLMPRLLGLAERAWVGEPPARGALDDAWSEFANRLGQRILPNLDADRPAFGYRIPPPGLLRQDGKVLANIQFPGLALRYTTDGSEPTAASPLVTGPIAAHGRITVSAFDRNGRAGRSSTLDNP